MTTLYLGNSSSSNGRPAESMLLEGMTNPRFPSGVARVTVEYVGGKSGSTSFPGLDTPFSKFIVIGIDGGDRCWISRTCFQLFAMQVTMASIRMTQTMNKLMPMASVSDRAIFFFKILQFAVTIGADETRAAEVGVDETENGGELEK